MTDSRAKGQRGEREVAELLRAYGLTARRGYQYRGADEPDIICNLPGCHLEVKRCEQYRIKDWMEQATRDAPGYDVPVVVHRRNHDKRWLCTLPFEDLLELLGYTKENT